MFGPCEFDHQADSLYPDRLLKKDSTIIWAPALKVHVGIASYTDACWNGDEAALAKLREWGIPENLPFGYRKGDDLTATYAKAGAAKPRKKKADSVKVMRASFGARFEDGGEFRKGDVVKIVFRKKYVKTVGGSKRFENAYERPTDEELGKFLAAEREGSAS